MTVRIQLACGKEIVVDKEDAPRVRQHGWGLSKHGHITGTMGNKRVLPHHFIMGRKPPKGYRVIHINYDLLDFRRENLGVSHSVACQRQPLKIGTTSRYKGVTYHKRVEIGWRGLQMVHGVFIWVPMIPRKRRRRRMIKQPVNTTALCAAKFS